MPAGWAAAAGAVVGGVGSYMASKSDSDAASAQAQGYRQLSEQQFQRAQEAAGKYGEFKPVTVTSMFGTPQYTYDANGRLTGVSSAAAPWLANLQQQGQGMAGQYQNLQQEALSNKSGYNASNQAFGAANNLYNLAGKAMPTNYDTTQATQDYYNQMQGLVAPGREQQLASTRNNLFQRGRQGLAVGATQAGGMAATNPEMAAYYNAVAQQDASMAMQSKEKALADLTSRQNLGLGLFQAGGSQATLGGNALNQYYTNLSASQSPFTTGMSQLSALEAQQYQPVTQGMAYGGTVMNQGNTIADAYMRAAGAGSQYAAQGLQSQYNADASNPWASLVMGAGQAIGRSAGAFGGSGQTGGSGASGSYSQAISNYGSGGQVFGNPSAGWSYGGFKP